MRKLYGLLSLLALSVGLQAQTTNVTATVVDSQSTTWINSTWTLSFIPSPYNPNPNAYTINGSPLSQTVINQTGSANGSGVLSFTTYQTGAISPTGSSWKLTICPAAQSKCEIYNFVTGGSSQDISSGVTANITPPSFLAIAGAYGYNDTEALLTLNPGSTYWNTTTNNQRCYTGSAWTNCSGSGGSGTVSSGVAGQTAAYLANGTTVAGASVSYLLPPSGDTTGATDGANIQSQCAANGSVQLETGTYFIGASNNVITLSAPCRILGTGTQSTIIDNKGTTNNWFSFIYYTAWQEGPWIYPASTTFSELGEMQFVQVGTPTAGYIVRIGSGQAHGPDSTYYYTMGVHVHDTVANGMWGGADLENDELYAFIDHNIWRQCVGGGAIYYNAEVGSGDNHIDNNQFSGLTNCGIIVTQSDTTFFDGDKLNGSGISFTGAGTTYATEFDNLSVETGQTQSCALNFGTGSSPQGVQFNNGEMLGFTTDLCNIGNATNFSGSFFNNTAISGGTDYPANSQVRIGQRFMDVKPASGGPYCVDIDNAGYLHNTGSTCNGGSTGQWPPMAAAPTFSPVAGTISSGTNVTTSCSGGSPYISAGTTAIAGATGIVVSASETLYGSCQGSGYFTEGSAAYVVPGSGIIATGKTCTAQGGSTATSITCTWSSAPAIGESIHCAAWNGESVTFALSDSGSNSYANNGSILTSGTFVMQLFNSFNVTASITTTTLTVSGSSNSNFPNIACFSTTGDAGTVDGAVGTYTNASTTSVTTTVVPTHSTDLAVQGIEIGIVTTITPPSGCTYIPTGGGHGNVGIAYCILTTSGSQNFISSWIGSTSAMALGGTNY